MALNHIAKSLATKIDLIKVSACDFLERGTQFAGFAYFRLHTALPAKNESAEKSNLSTQSVRLG